MRARHALSRMVRLLVPCAAILATGCIHRFVHAERQDLTPATLSADTVDALLRVHLADGGIAMFQHGAEVGPAGIRGTGIRHDLSRLRSWSIEVLPLDSVLGIEAYSEQLHEGRTVGISLLATAATPVLVMAAAVAAFGSCPTVYTDSAGVEALEAELFSYSIAPLLEGRDVDVMRGRPDARGTLRLDVRNEALETHFINHLQLLEVRHASDETVVPDRYGSPVAGSRPLPAVRAVDRTGRDVAHELHAPDGAAFATTEDRLEAASESDLFDHIDLVFRKPAADSAALVLRMRNSLLNTVLFYDVMMGAAGARALDWMAGDLQRIGPAVELGRWWVDRMGMRVAVRSNGRYHEVGRLPDSGPIAWNEVAIVIPVPIDAGDELHVRLTFVADEWRIDRVALAEQWRRIEPRVLPAARVLHSDGVASDSARAALAEPDDEYLRTTAGDRFLVEFDAGPEPSAGTRTFLLSSQGWYSEWVRPAWIRASGAGQTFEATDASLLDAMRRWRGVREDFERRFRDSRIPTR